jgi:predicted transcriptional regulator
MRVSELMENPFPEVDENLPVEAVSFLLRYSPAVLTTKKGELVGIITDADLSKVLAK